ncbi:hypothetical protein [Massilia sp. Root335]|jgi:hypothetical protein|uniref:hypothetical protein n=1 Tax=Massilia sp. Root335 TaxID=1736517 RepID=UPI0006F678EB|nr:hypothetical protein [Massilia sp. Root335]
MRRLILIVLLLVYPFQVALAVADKCCAMTPAGVSHHSVVTGADTVFLADDDGASLTDPHCAACTFGHTACLPAQFVVIPADRRHASDIAFFPPFLTAPPASRPERPKWSAAA